MTAQTNDEITKWIESLPKDEDGFTIIGNTLITTEDIEDYIATWNASRLAALDDLQNLFREKGFIEKLADMEHDRWSRWELYRKRITDKDLNVFNSSIIEGWKRKSNQTYSELTEAEQESDRVEARKTLTLILAELEALRKKAEG